MSDPNCDNDKCLLKISQIRVLPTGGDGNLLLCKSCYDNEIVFRKERNKSLETANKFKLPNWPDLRIYFDPDIAGIKTK